MVMSGSRDQVRSTGLRFIIQSEKDTIHLENRIEDFLNKLQVQEFQLLSMLYIYKKKDFKNYYFLENN